MRDMDTLTAGTRVTGAPWATRYAGKEGTVLRITARPLGSRPVDRPWYVVAWDDSRETITRGVDLPVVAE